MLILFIYLLSFIYQYKYCLLYIQGDRENSVGTLYIVNIWFTNINKKYKVINK